MSTLSANPPASASPPAEDWNTSTRSQTRLSEDWTAVAIGFLVIALVLMHVGAALYHYFVRHDTVLQRMLPRAMGGL